MESHFSCVSSNVIEVKFGQLVNTEPPIIVTLFGMIMDFSSEQLEKADSAISVIPLGIFIDVKLLQLLNRFLLIISMLEESSTEDKFVHPENAPRPIDVTLAGIVTESKFGQPLNAKSSIAVTLPSVGISLVVLHPETRIFVDALIKQFSLT